jgi:ABC-type phosphate transport system substrate-binding protein
MRFLSARGLAPACIAAVATMGLVAPGTALAKKVTTACSGVNVTGQGASTQKAIQQGFWNPQFNSSTDKFACSGSQGTGGKPTVAYTSTGSGTALKSWGIETKAGETINFGPTNAFLGTDEPPSAAQEAELLKEESAETAGTVLTIPVLQVAVAPVVHLPSGCTATSTPAPGRLVLSQKTLEGIFAGTVTTWGAIKDGGDTLTGAGCAEAPIQVVVRQDQSGTTHIIKRFLNLLDTAALETESGTHTWGELSEGSLNTVWPTAAKVIRPAAKGGGEEVAKVAATPGSIGYAGVADARANAAFVPGTGGPGTATFWAELENESKKGKAKYQDPSNNGDVAAKAESNCKKTLYSNGKIEFPPPTAKETWNEVTSKTSEKTYPLCGFSFVVAVSKYSLLPGTSAGEAETVKNYVQYVIDKKGGQPLLLTSDYLTLPTEVLKIAVTGATEIGN